MSEENGSAEQQASRIDERATGASAPGRQFDVDDRGMSPREGSGARLRRAGRQALANPAGPLILGLALIAGSAALIAVRNAQTRPGLRLLKRRSRELGEAFRERDLAVGPRVLGVLAKLAALGLAGMTWGRMRAMSRDRYD
jgi:hypothetical protein